ncbi:MAG: helix-turn-helix domain-containing protein [Bdellovibrionota bacterium]
MDLYTKNIKDIGILVRKVRVAKNLSQEKAAGLTGVGRRFLSELEGGKKPTLEFGLVLQVLNRLGIKLKLEAKIDG